MLGARARHGLGRERVAVPGPGATLALARLTGGGPEASLDGAGLLRDAATTFEETLTAAGAEPRLRAFGIATLGYLAGLADGALEPALQHVRDREQFGAPLAALPAVQGRLADAALLRDGLLLLAWESATAEDTRLPRAALAWAGPACCEVTRQALQVHGGIGFALESGVHRPYRRAKAAQVWADAVLDATA